MCALERHFLLFSETPRGQDYDASCEQIGKKKAGIEKFPEKKISSSSSSSISSPLLLCIYSTRDVCGIPLKRTRTPTRATSTPNLHTGDQSTQE